MMKFQKVTIFLLLAISSCSSYKLLTEKAAFFANSVFNDFSTSVVWWHEEPDDVTDFIKQFRGCVIVAPVQDNDFSDELIREFTTDKRFQQTVFFGSEVSEVEYFLSRIYRNVLIPIHIIVVLTKPASNTELSEIIEVAWNYDVADILIVSSNDEDVLLTTYFPYRKGKCGDFTPVHLSHDTKELFQKKFMNFHGCEIRTTLLQMSPYSRLKFENNSLVSISGIDGKILNTIFNIFNASMRVTSAMDHGGVGAVVNGTATGSLADIINKKADVFLPGLLMNIARYPYVQFSHPFETATIIWFGPRRRELSEWIRVFQPFMSPITPAFFSTYIVFVIVNMTIRRVELHRSLSRESVLFQTFIIFLGIEVKFETKSLRVNCLFVLWIWFCMVVRIVYQGVLVEGLQRIALEAPFHSFESAVKLVDGYGALENLRKVFCDTEYYDKFQEIPFKNISYHLKLVEAGKRFLIAADKQLGLDSAPNLQIIDDDPLIAGPVNFLIRPGWPAVEDFNNILTQMIEKGLVEKVFREHSWEWAKAVGTKDDREAKPLTLAALTGCFYVLGVMYGVCSLVLFVEIVYHRMNLDKKKTLFKRK